MMNSTISSVCHSLLSLEIAGGEGGNEQGCEEIKEKGTG